MAINTPTSLKKKAARGEDITDKRAMVHMGMTNTRIMTGQEDLSLWTDEELKRGRRKGKNNRWSGRPPSVVPKAIHDELVRRTLDRANEILRENLVVGVQCLVDLVQGEDVDDKVRLQAALAIKDAVMGKAPASLEINATVKTYEKVFDSIEIKRDVIDVPLKED